MSVFDFLPDDVFHDLPEDRIARYTILLKAASTEYEKLIKDKTRDIRDQLAVAYMAQVSIIAEEHGFGRLPITSAAPVSEHEWSRFQTALAGIMTRIRLSHRNAVDPYSVALGRITKHRIEQEIDRLRRLIADADISERKKKSLNTKLDELVEELHRDRLSFAKLAAVAAAIAGLLGGTSATLANGPEAIETIGRILHWVGEEKAAEDAEQLRLAPPPKALPAPNGSTGEEPADD